MAVPSIQIKRHHRRLSEKETTELVEAVAEMVVTFIKTRAGERARPPQRPSAETKPTSS